MSKEIKETIVNEGPSELELDSQRQARLEALAAGAADETFGEGDEEDLDPASLLTPEALASINGSEDPVVPDEPEPPAEEPAEEQEPQAATPPPDPMEAIDRFADRVAAKMLAKPQETPAPQLSKRDQLRESYQKLVSPEGLQAVMREHGLQDTPEVRRDLVEKFTLEARQLDAYYLAEEARLEASALRAENERLKLEQSVAPALEKAEVSRLPEKAQALVRHYVHEFVAMGNAPAKAVELALAETGFSDILAAQAKAAPAKPGSPQRRASDRAIAAQAVAGRAQPTATQVKRKPAGSDEERFANIYRLARSGF